MVNNSNSPQLPPLSVLDKGYVRLVDTLGDDRSVVNAARVSYDKEVAELSLKDERLMVWLWNNGHTSPFRHAALTFEVYAPLFVARQWWKYVVGSTHQDVLLAWNESSRRYITENEEFYVPEGNQWRSKPANSKQGSGEPLPAEEGAEWTEKLLNIIDQGAGAYQAAMEAGIAPEQARLFLPAYGLYVRWRWTVSLQGVLHFLDQRLEHDAQKEIQDYAKAVKVLTQTVFPSTTGIDFKQQGS